MNDFLKKAPEDNTSIWERLGALRSHESKGPYETFGATLLVLCYAFWMALVPIPVLGWVVAITLIPVYAIGKFGIGLIPQIITVGILWDVYRKRFSKIVLLIPLIIYGLYYALYFEEATRIWSLESQIRAENAAAMAKYNPAIHTVPVIEPTRFLYDNTVGGTSEFVGGTLEFPIHTLAIEYKGNTVASIKTAAAKRLSAFPSLVFSCGMTVIIKRGECRFGLYRAVYELDVMPRGKEQQKFLQAARCKNSDDPLCTSPQKKQQELNQSRARANVNVAFKKWGPLAEQGDAIAQYRMGKLYQQHLSDIKENPEEAKKFLRKSAEQGYIPAQLEMGKICLREKTPEAMGWLLKASEQGNIDAQLIVARRYFEGTNEAPPNYSEAYFWYSVAAKENSVNRRALTDAKNKLTADEQFAIEHRAAEWEPTFTFKPAPESPKTK